METCDNKDEILALQKKFDVETYLKSCFKNHNIEISNTDLDRFRALYDCLIETNRFMNLTSIVDPQEICVKHFLDSVLPMDLIPECKDVVDLGCGGGFPCLPLAIMRPDLRIKGLDSIHKKVEYVNETAEVIGVQHTFTAFNGRIETYGHDKYWREKFDIVVARAVAPLNTLLEYAAPFLKDGGKMILYKGSCYDDEIENAKSALKALNCKLTKIVEYEVEEYLMKRYALIITKHGKLNKKYPRSQNKPRLDPL